MSSAFHDGRGATQRRVLRITRSFPIHVNVPCGMPSGAPSGNVLLSPLEQEILSVCLHSPEDPRDIGMLPALLSVERRARGSWSE